MREATVDLWEWLGICQTSLAIVRPTPRQVWVLNADDLRQGFVRPLRLAYVHTRCQQTTRINKTLARVWARNPTHYHEAFCAHCRQTFPVGRSGEFVWKGSNERVGT